MAKEYTLRFNRPCLDKQILDDLLSKLGFTYSEYEDLPTGYRIDEFSNVTGFSMIYSRRVLSQFPFENEVLPTPFESVDCVMMRLSDVLDWPAEIDNVLQFCLSLLQFVTSNALLDFNYDYVYLLRQIGEYSIDPRAGIWQTPTGQAFLAQTPHTYLPDRV
ncbi:SitI3 family protein [Fibrella aquatilis]|uniref:SitI3 family protein n=1 Tax=Fibrella aquatilis TaxID=2817059 RepID=UPI0035B6095A